MSTIGEIRGPGGPSLPARRAARYDRRMTMVDVQVGETVIIYERTKSHRDAVITKVGRVWITVDSHGVEGMFCLDDQTDGSDSAFAPHFYTLAQWAEKLERDTASAYLRDQGIEIRWESPWRDRVVEVAKAIQSIVEVSQ